MRILGIDTSTMVLALGVVSEEKVLAETKLDVEATYSEILLSSIDQLLKNIQMKIEDIDGFSIAIGPGSFTGLRIGLSTVKGLAYALKKPVASVITLDALASLYPFSNFPIGAMLDAKKQEVYFALYNSSDSGIKRISDYLVIPPENLGEIIKEKTLLIGPGAKVYKKNLEKSLKEKAVFLDSKELFPSGVIVAKLGMEKIKKGEIEDIEKLEPFYIRKSEQELKKRFL